MSIYDEIRNLNDKINILKEKQTKELNEVNYHYWPIIAEIKKKKRRIFSFVAISSCLVAIVLILIILGEIRNEILVAGSLTIVLSLLILSLVFLYLIESRKKSAKMYWEKALTTANNIKNEIMFLSNQATSLMLTAFKTEKDEIIKITGTSYDDVLEYYNQWVENI